MATQIVIDFAAEQAAQLRRVSGLIAPTVLEFCRGRLGREFSDAELLAHVRAVFPSVAPGSPARVMRDLRRHGLVDVECVSRSRSLYRVSAAAALIAFSGGAR